MAYNLKKNFLIRECVNAVDEINTYYAINQLYPEEYYLHSHSWLTKYLSIYEQITELSQSYERNVKQGNVKEINHFFDRYNHIEIEFKQNYFQYLNVYNPHDQYT